VDIHGFTEFRPQSKVENFFSRCSAKLIRVADSVARDVVSVLARIWSIERLTKRAAPLINLSVAQHSTNCAILGQSRSALAKRLGLLRVGFRLGLGLVLGLGLGKG